MIARARSAWLDANRRRAIAKKPLLSISEACELLSAAAGRPWNLSDLAAHAVPFHIYMDFDPRAPAELFAGYPAGFLAPIIFAGDMHRLAAGAPDVVMTMTRRPDGQFVSFTPGLEFDVDALQVKRGDVERLAEHLRTRTGG